MIKRYLQKAYENKATYYRSLIKSGFVFFPPSFLLVIYALNSFAHLIDSSLTTFGYFISICISIALCIVIGIRNEYLYIFRRKRCYSTLRDYFKEELYSPRRVKAMYPGVDANYLYKEITGVCAGIVGTGVSKRYFCIDPHDPNQANHILINGNSKAGKTSGPIITSILAYFAHLRPNTPISEKISWVVIDTKPEIAKKCTHGEPDVNILNPADRNSGWNLYHSISPTSSDDEISNCICAIIEIVIPLDPKNEFFVDSARSLLEGGLFYEFKINHLNFINSILKILSEDLDAYVTHIKRDPNAPEKAKMLLSEYGMTKKPDGTDKTDE